jgi:hypothetical protein
VIYAALALALGGCRLEATSGGTAASTQTIEPAKPQPGDTDTTALTQTVDVEAGRSEVEGRTANGADITAASDTVTTSTAATTTAPPPAPTTTTR